MDVAETSEPVRLLKTKRRPSSRKMSQFQAAAASPSGTQSPLIDSGIHIEPPMSQRSSPVRPTEPVITMEEVPSSDQEQETTPKDDDEFDDSKKDTPGGHWVSKVRNGSIRGSLIVTTANNAVRSTSPRRTSSHHKESISIQEEEQKAKEESKESLDSSKSKDSSASAPPLQSDQPIQIQLERVPSLELAPPTPPQKDTRSPFKPVVKRQSVLASPSPRLSPSIAPVSPQIRPASPLLDPSSKIQARKASAFPSLNIFSRGGRESIFSSSLTAATPSPPKQEEENDAESAFVLSRLDTSASLDMTPATSTTESSWGITGQLQSAFQALKDNLVGDYTSEGEIDWDFWGKLVTDYEGTIRKQPKYFTQQLSRGIPETLRGLMWQLMCKGKSERYITMYRSLLTRSSPKDEKIIQRDLTRTFPTHPHFREVNGPGQQSLFNVLKAFAIHDPDTGYCQGIAFVLGPLLLNMPEEDAFCVLVQLMREYGFRDLYSPKLVGLQLRIYQFEKLLEERFPQVAEHLASLDVKATMYASQWFMTLFAYRFPLEMVFRIMDIVFAEGYDAVLRFALALVQRNQAAILATNEFEAILDFLQNGLFDVYIGNIDALIYDASQIKITKTKLEKLADAHKADVRLVSPDFLQVQSLQNDNYILQDRLKMLEIDYEKLNQEHVQMASAMVELKLGLETAKERNEELEEKISGLTSILSADRKVIEDQVRSEMDQLAQKNLKLAHKNAELEEQVSYIQELLANSEEKWAQAESARADMYEKFENLTKRFK